MADVDRGQLDLTYGEMNAAVEKLVDGDPDATLVELRDRKQLTGALVRIRAGGRVVTITAASRRELVERVEALVPGDG